MSPRAIFLGGARLQLDDRTLLGEGGEGRVYRVADLAIKVFTTPGPERERKLRAFPRGLPPQVVGPLDLCTDGRGDVVGFSMRALDGAHDLSRFGQRRWREGRVSNAELLVLFRDLARTVNELHRRGVVVGDLNDGNVVVTRPGAHGHSPWLIDADSMQFGAHPCVVAHERFLDPRLYGKELGTEALLSRETDWYALAVLLFSSLLYVHPFGGAHPSLPTLLRRAEARCSVLQPVIKLPASAVRPDVLPDAALDWFARVFEGDLRAPLPSDLLDASFTRCSCGAEHARRRCPVCATVLPAPAPVRAQGRIRALRVFGGRGRVVEAAAPHGELRYAYDDGDGLVREDGARVLRRPARGASAGDLATAYLADPGATVRIAGLSTWIGAGGRMTRLLGDRAVESVPVGMVHGEIAADAGPSGLVHAIGDALVRSADGTRLGRILEGQTHVRVGTSLGFAFYRAGGVTVAFVFDPRRGALRQVEGFPPLRGKLVAWSAAFDAAHVLARFTTEEGGRTERAAHLLDARGGILASERSSSASGTVLTRTAGAGLPAVVGGRVLAVGGGGLVLLQADPITRTFAEVRLFAEASSFVSPETDLLAGSGGAAFAVSHDEILELLFVA